MPRLSLLHFVTRRGVGHVGDSLGLVQDPVDKGCDPSLCRPWTVFPLAPSGGVGRPEEMASRHGSIVAAGLGRASGGELSRRVPNHRAGLSGDLISA